MKKLKLVLIMCITLTVETGFGQSVMVNKENVANNGYDVVNYFTSNSAERGSSKYSVEYKNATYYFANSENLGMFNENPSKYLPQFDGYCAFAVAKMNQKVPVDPNTFRIDDGKLYLFYNDYWEGKPFNTIVPWLNNESQMEAMAKENWAMLKDK